MKIRVVFFSVLLAAMANAAPRAQILSVSESGDRLVVNYSLAEAAIVVADIQTNVAQDVYASVGGEHQWTLDGDVNKSVAAGSRSLTWTPSSDLPDCDIDPCKVKVVLTTYPVGDAPDYMVVRTTRAPRGFRGEYPTATTFRTRSSCGTSGPRASRTAWVRLARPGVARTNTRTP